MLFVNKLLPEENPTLVYYNKVDSAGFYFFYIFAGLLLQLKNSAKNSKEQAENQRAIRIMANMVKEIREHIESKTKKNQDLVIKDIEQSIGHVLTMLELESAFEEKNKLWLAKNIEQITASGKKFYLEALNDFSFIKKYLSFPAFIKEEQLAVCLKEITELLIMDSQLFAQTIEKKLLTKDSAYFEAIIYPLHQNQAVASQEKNELIGQLIVLPETAEALSQELQAKITSNKTIEKELRALFKEKDQFTERLFSDVLSDIKNIINKIETDLAEQAQASLFSLGITQLLPVLKSNVANLALENIHTALLSQKNGALQETVLKEINLFVQILASQYCAQFLKISRHNINKTIASINDKYLHKLKALYQHDIYNLFFALFGKFFGDIEGCLDFVSDKKIQKKVEQYKRLYNHKETKKYLGYLKNIIVQSAIASGLSKQDLQNFIESFLHEQFNINAPLSERKESLLKSFLAFRDPDNENISAKILLKKIATGIKSTDNRKQAAAFEAEETLFCWATICEFSKEEYVRYILGQLSF